MATKMEDDQNGRRPNKKTTKIEDDQNRRRPKRKTTKMEDNQNGRQQKRKTTNMEDDLIDVGDCGWRVNQPGNSAIPRFRDFSYLIVTHLVNKEPFTILEFPKVKYLNVTAKLC